MSIAPDDPRLTAYALGELDELDRPEVEALVAAEPEARAFVDEVRATARLLSESLRDEPGPALEPEHRQAIEARLNPEARPARSRPRRWAELAIAAGLLGLTITLVYPWLRPTRPADREVAMALKASRAAAEPRLGRAMAPIIDAPSPAVPGVLTEPQAVPAITPADPAHLSSIRTFDRASGGTPVLAEKDSPNSLGLALQSGPKSKYFIKGEVEARSEAVGRGSNARAESFAESNRGRGLTPASGLPPAGAKGLAYAPAPVMERSLNPRDHRPGSVANAPSAPAMHEGLVRARTGLARESLASSKPDAAPVAKAEGLADAKGRAGQLKANEAEALDKLETRLSSLQEIALDRNKVMDEQAQAGGEVHPPITDNKFLSVNENPLSTFSIDVDTASYANVRRYLNQNTRPPADAVRIEELVNYFPYNYPAPKADEPFSVTCEVARAPWDVEHRLVRIGLKGREIPSDKRPPSNLVFLIDVSGSMADIDKLPLLKAGMKLLVEQLGENDRVAIVVYAARVGIVLDSTRADRKSEILSSLEQLQAGGATNGGRGILLAYDVAVRNFIPGGTNRVILATDGDFNLGVTQGPELDRLIEEKRGTGVFLSVLGFGQGNVKHDKLEGLADKGNGQYCYIDTIKEARKVLVEQVGSTLVAIAKDVKIQVAFDPEKTSAYRLIGYENRMLENRDFEDDRKDAGEIGAGHCVTALYEVVPTTKGDPSQVNAKVRASQLAQQAARGNARLLEVRLRCKAPDGDVSRMFTCPADDDGRDFAAASGDFRFASSVAGFGMLLRNSPHKGTLTWDGLIELASGAVGVDPGGYRNEFLGLVRKAREIVAR